MTNQFSHVVLSSADYIIMACYMLVLILMSIYYRKFAQANMDNYFLGGRNLKGWLNGTSYAATCMNANVAPAYCGMTVITGLYICWWYISRFGLALMIGGILFAVFSRRTKIFTSPEFYELRFSSTPAILMRSWVALRSSFIAVIAWTVGTAIGYGGDVAPMAGAMEGQRLLSCRNAREALKMYIWTEVVLFFMLAVLTLPALGAMVKWPGLHDGTINKELSYGMLLGHYLLSGLLGLAIIFLFASIMSTVDSNMNFGAQVFINDVYRRSIKSHQSMTHYMRVGKIVMLVIMGLSILVAYHAEMLSISLFLCSACLLRS